MQNVSNDVPNAPQGHSHKRLLIVAAILIVMVAALVYVVLTQKNLSTVVENESQSSSSDETADWKTYRNEEYGFEFRYPEEWTLMDRQSNLIDFGPGSIELAGGYIGLDLACVSAFGGPIGVQTTEERTSVMYGTNTFEEFKGFIIS